MRFLTVKPKVGDKRVHSWFAWLPVRIQYNRPDYFIPAKIETRWLECVTVLQLYGPFMFGDEKEWINVRFVDGVEDKAKAEALCADKGAWRPDDPPKHP